MQRASNRFRLTEKRIWDVERRLGGPTSFEMSVTRLLTPLWIWRTLRAARSADALLRLPPRNVLRGWG